MVEHWWLFLVSWGAGYLARVCQAESNAKKAEKVVGARLKEIAQHNADINARATFQQMKAAHHERF